MNRRRALTLAAALGLAIVIALGWRPAGRLAEGVDLLQGLAAGQVLPMISRTPIAFTVDGVRREADFYRDRERPPKAGIVAVPGAHPAGRDEARLVQLAHTLAAHGFAVLVPEITSLRRLNVTAGDADPIADTLRHLASELGSGRPLGVAAISYAVGPAVIAANRAELKNRVDFLLGVGGYYDTGAVVTFFTTGNFRETREDAWRYLAPNAYGKWVFVRANATRLADADDRRLLVAIATRRLGDISADITDLVAGLGSEGKAVLALLDNRDPDRVPALLGALPPAIREELAALDLSRRDLGGDGPVLLLAHGRDDAIVPYSESLALAAAAGRDRAHLYLLDGLGHADLAPQTWRDRLTLVRLAYRLLALRDGGGPAN